MMLNLWRSLPPTPQRALEGPIGTYRKNMKLNDSRDFRGFLHFLFFKADLGSRRPSIVFAAQFQSTPRSQYLRSIFLHPFQPFFDIFLVLYWSDFQFFWKSWSQTALSGQSPLSKMIVYWSSSYEVFIQSWRFHRVLPITLPLFMKKHFFILALYLQL